MTSLRPAGQNRIFLPNLFILGAAKCGTTSLHAYLDRQRGICMSNPKEPFFFEAEYEKGLEFYRRTYFSHWQEEQIIGEARHRNLYLPFIPKRIHKENPNAKLIILVRNPVKRAFSHWFHNYSRNSDNLLFSEAIQEDWRRISDGLRYDTEEEIRQHALHLGPKTIGGEIGLGIYRTYLDSGYYMEQIERYLSLFPRENLKVIVFEEFVKRQIRVMEDMMEFLDLDHPISDITSPIWVNRQNTTIYNKATSSYRLYQLVRNFVYGTRLVPWRASRTRRFVADALLPKPATKMMDEASKTWLENHYREHNNKLEQFLNLDLSIWGW